MKTLWTVVAVLAVANMVALLGFVGWLKASDRLDVERVKQVREMFSRTVTADRAALAAEAARVDEERKKAEEEAKASRPPLTAAERLAAVIQATELDEQRVERLRREIQDLQKRIVDGEAKLAADRRTFEQERDAFLASSRREREQAADAQFQKTLGVIQSLKPAEAARVLASMLAPGTPGGDPANPVAPAAEASAPAAPVASPVSGGAAAGDGMSLCVEYLNAMDDRPRGRIIAEFVKTDPALAGELLERLRRRGQLASGVKDPSR